MKEYLNRSLTVRLARNYKKVVFEICQSIVLKYIFD